MTSTRRRFLTAAGLLPALVLAQPPMSGPSGRTWKVGVGGDFASLREASKVVRDGDTIELAAGDYSGDAAVWTQRELTIRGTGGVARLSASGAHAEGKGIFVIRSDRFRIENLAFVGARVPDGNGAGIRLERGRLEVAHCLFEDNENGILTGNDANTELSIANSTFLRNGTEDGHGHTIYAGLIRRLDISGCYLARGRVGHLLKSRAQQTNVSYSRITGEDGTASYELELPNGGLAMLLGNLIQQGPLSQNSAIISYGAEGYQWPTNELKLSFNTIVNDRSQGGVFLLAQPGNASIATSFNLFVGEGSIEVKCRLNRAGDQKADRNEFANPSKFDFHLKSRSKLVGAAGMASQLRDAQTAPSGEYAHIAGVRSLDRTSGLTPVSPGAFQALAGA